MAGRPKTGGRKRGVKNKRTVVRELALADTAEKIAAALGPDGFAGDAHAVLIAIYKDLTRPIELRMDAAKAAIGYEKPRLAAVDTAHTGDGLTLADLVDMSYEVGKRRKAAELERRQPAAKS